MAHHKHTGSCLTSTMWVSKKVSSKMSSPLRFHIMCNLYQIPMSHIIRSHATPPHLFHAAHPFQTAYWWACPLYAPASPNFLVRFRLMKECVASLSTHDTFLPLIWASRYNKLGLGLRLLALATKPPSNVWSTHQHDLPWYHKATNISSVAQM